MRVYDKSGGRYNKLYRQYGEYCRKMEEILQACVVRYMAVTVQPGLCVCRTDRMKTRSLWASGYILMQLAVLYFQYDISQCDASEVIIALRYRFVNRLLIFFRQLTIIKTILGKETIFRNSSAE